MGYSSFSNLKKVVQNFGITVESTSFFEDSEIQGIIPSDWLVGTIERANYLGFDSEKERSERLVSPILSELAMINKGQITIYSGHELNVDKDLGLVGECDYLLTLGKKVLDFIHTPIFSIVEAKKQDIDYGTAQCTAQMIGAKRYNEEDGNSTALIYGATTDGEKWRFFRLIDKNLQIHQTFYYTKEINFLLGVLQFILNDCEKVKSN
jgi:hypothetical protein